MTSQKLAVTLEVIFLHLPATYLTMYMQVIDYLPAGFQLFTCGLLTVCRRHSELQLISYDEGAFFANADSSRHQPLDEL